MSSEGKGGDGARGLVPKLRFPTFQDAGGWASIKIGAIADIHKGKGIAKADISSTGRQPCIRYGELYTLYGETIDNVVSKTNIPKSELFMSRRNDVIIPASGETKIDIATAACVLHDDIALGGDLNVLRSKQNGVFLSYFLNGRLKPALAHVAQGDSVVHLYPAQIGTLSAAIPSLAEQHKIAECLSSLDAVIAAEGERLAALKDQKTGLMQVLFPAPGQTMPRFRFPEFKDAGEWKERLLGDVIVTVTPPKKLQTAQYAQSGAFPIIDQGKEDVAGWTDDESAVISEDLPLIIFGDHTCVLKLARTPFAQGADGIKILNVGSELSIEYLYQSLLNDPLSMEDYKRHFAQLKERRVCFPDVRTGEQERIVGCLSALDEQVTAQRNRIDSLKAHKKALLQQLFPAPAASA